MIPITFLFPINFSFQNIHVDFLIGAPHGYMAILAYSSGGGGEGTDF